MELGSLITDPLNPASSVAAKDLVGPVIYDAFGREVRKYLPYASTDAAGTFKLDPFGQQAAPLHWQHKSHFGTGRDLLLWQNRNMKPHH